jgi:quinolinate synthase
VCGWRGVTVERSDPRHIVRQRKRELGNDLFLLAHHYQRDEIVEEAHVSGDSLELARKAAEVQARYVVLCGVHFMAESAYILKRPHQVVTLPHASAGCPLASMCTAQQLEEAFRGLEEAGPPGPLVPVTYINSSAETKAFCGKAGGTVCTSSNARDAMAWALEQGGRVLFAPDRNLGLNTAAALGIHRGEIAVWDPVPPRGGLETQPLVGARLVVWKGYCHVHTFFTLEHVRRVREAHPSCSIIVHPECAPEVVNSADEAGSTSTIVSYIADAEPGSTVVVGTEIHLVARLARLHPDKTILPLASSECPDMARTTMWCLARALEEPEGERIVGVDEAVASDARRALERMLAI